VSQADSVATGNGASSLVNVNLKLFTTGSILLLISVDRLAIGSERKNYSV
jgi:hypothetical protein